MVASYIECVLRYGLPADYFICAITPDPKSAKKVLATLSAYFRPFTPSLDTSNARLVSSGKDKKRKTKASNSTETDESALVGEFQSLMEQEVFEFVLQEVPTYTGEGSNR